MLNYTNIVFVDSLCSKGYDGIHGLGNEELLYSKNPSKIDFALIYPYECSLRKKS